MYKRGRISVGLQVSLHRENRMNMTVRIFITLINRSSTADRFGDGGISFLKKGVQGKLYYSRNNARGVVDRLQGESQRDNLREQRECMQPYIIDRILDAILGNQGAASSSNRQLPRGFSIDDKGFVLRSDGQRICQTIQHDAPPPVVIGESVTMTGGRRETVCKLYDGTRSQE